MRDNILTPAPNSTQVPNVILDEWMPILKPTEFCVLMVIVRQTFGWIEDIATGRRKEKDWISHSQLEEKTGKQREAIGLAIKALRTDYDLIEAYDRNGVLLTTPKLSNHVQIFYRIKTSSLAGTTKSEKPTGPPSRKTRLDQVGKPDMTKETLLQKKPLPNPPPGEGTRPDGSRTPRQDENKKGDEQFSYSKLMAYSGKPYQIDDFMGLTDAQLWELGMELSLHTRVVRAQYDSIMHMAKTGELQKYVSHLPSADTKQLVRRWLQRRIAAKQIVTWTDFEEYDMQNNSPDAEAERQRIAELAWKKISKS